MLPAVLCALVSAAALCGSEAAATSLLRRAPRQQQIEISDAAAGAGGDAESEYSVSIVGKKARGLHELSIAGALSGDRILTTVARARSPFIVAWPAFYKQLEQASGLACGPVLDPTPGRRSASTGNCVRWLSSAIEAGVAWR